MLVAGSEEPFHEPWELRVFALWAVTAVEGLGAGSGRVQRERMLIEEYLRASYYERWQWSNERRLLDKGTIAERDVDAWADRLRAGEHVPTRNDSSQTGRVLQVVRISSHELGPVGATRFAPGDRARVRRLQPTGHTRCPRYVRGVEGVVEHVRGTYPLPDEGPRCGEVEPVYGMSFRSDDVFGPSDQSSWRVFLDLHESYLEAV